MIVVQPNIKQADPIIGRHWSTIDTERLLAHHMFALSCELREAGAQVPVAVLFALEATGYSVDLATGTVTEASQ